MYYSTARIITDSQLNNYFELTSTLLPNIPFSDADTYVRVGVSDRVDLLADQFYEGDTSMYRVILLANEITGDSLFMEPGSIVRIPAITKNAFLELLETYNKGI
jgi:hypothetical protein